METNNKKICRFLYTNLNIVSVKTITYKNWPRHCQTKKYKHNDPNNTIVSNIYKKTIEKIRKPKIQIILKDHQVLIYEMKNVLWKIKIFVLLFLITKQILQVENNHN